MAPEKDKDRPDKKALRDEIEVAYYTKELGRELQRKLLQRRLADLSDNGRGASHGEEPSPDRSGVAPRQDRAG